MRRHRILKSSATTSTPALGLLAASLLVAATIAAPPAVAQEGPEEESRSMPMMDDAGAAGMEMGSMQGGSAPPDARDPHAYAEGESFTMGASRPHFADVKSYGSVLVDNLESTRVDGNTFSSYDLEAWYGRTFNRLVVKAEGEVDDGAIAESRTELLWGRAFAPFWDTQLGIRRDGGEGPSRDWLAFGVEGLAPYWFEVSITGYLGESSRSALRLDGSYELPITQRLILQPRLEANFYGNRDAVRGLGSGLADATAGLRLRYEFRREFAPYVGLESVRKYGETKDIAVADGEDPSDTRLVAGVRFWF